jgi:hypothetical protein
MHLPFECPSCYYSYALTLELLALFGRELLLGKCRFSWSALSETVSHRFSLTDAIIANRFDFGEAVRASECLKIDGKYCTDLFTD